jgi:hypothetical protein
MQSEDILYLLGAPDSLKKARTLFSEGQPAGEGGQVFQSGES